MIYREEIIRLLVEKFKMELEQVDDKDLTTYAKIITDIRKTFGTFPITGIRMKLKGEVR